jgi:hypothetical protein
MKPMHFDDLHLLSSKVVSDDLNFRFIVNFLAVAIVQICSI